jgi:putative flippase GtrA
MGMLVQLSLLGLMGRWAREHSLWATAAAIEATLLHNFTWHVRITWRDRREAATVGVQLVRFHLSNGMVSMVGNLMLMGLLVKEMKMPLLVANGLAIVCCSLVNFGLGDRWTFAGNSRGTGGREVVSDGSDETGRGVAMG